MKVTILDDYFDTLRQLPCFSLLDDHDVTVWTDHVEDIDILAERLADTEALVLFRERSQITDALLARLPRLRLLSNRGVYPHVDVDAATAHGVLLCSRSGGAGPSVATAELTIGLILAAMRGLPDQINGLKAGQWQTMVGRCIRDKTLGIYGYGGIGSMVAGFATAMGMKVQVWGRDAGLQRARDDGYTVPASRADFFGTADVLSLHVRMKPETRGLITAADLAQMPARSLLINTSRAGLIETGALEAALQAGTPSMAAVDVYDEEPITDGKHPLLQMPNVIATPHIGFVTEEDFNKMFTDMFDQINAFAAGEPIHMINPEVRG